MITKDEAQALCQRTIDEQDKLVSQYAKSDTFQNDLKVVSYLIEQQAVKGKDYLVINPQKCYHDASQGKGFMLTTYNTSALARYLEECGYNVVCGSATASAGSVTIWWRS